MSLANNFHSVLVVLLLIALQLQHLIEHVVILPELQSLQRDLVIWNLLLLGLVRALLVESSKDCINLIFFAFV